MLINLSNHIISEWSEKQLKLATTQYGEVIDISFPAVSPEADSDEVGQLALEVVCSICNKHIDEKFTVHIMGELTFVYAAVQEFHKRGIECIASTSQRKVSLLTNGEKVSRFHFVRFREYQPLSINYNS